MANPVLMARAAALLTGEKTRKGLGWIVAPLIPVVTALCILGSGAASHNISAVQMCFQDSPLPDDLSEEYWVCVEASRGHFAEIDTAFTVLQSNMKDGNSLDPTRVKAVFYALYFGRLWQRVVRPRRRDWRRSGALSQRVLRDGLPAGGAALEGSLIRKLRELGITGP